MTPSYESEFVSQGLNLKKKYVLIVALLIAAIAIFYLYVIIPAQNETKLNSCLKELQEEYERRRALIVAQFGDQAGTQLQALDQFLQLNREMCKKKYPVE